MKANIDRLLALQILIMFVVSAEPSHPGPTGYLNCDTGVTLQIFRNVRGTKNVDDPFVVQLFLSKYNNHVQIYGKKARRYICTKGRSAIAKRRSSKQCSFKMEVLNGKYMTFMQDFSKRKYLGLSKAGKPRLKRRLSSITKFTWVPINYKKIKKTKKSKDWLLLFKNYFNS